MLNITVEPVNDPPEVVTNNVVSVDEGGSVTISTAALFTQDADTPANNLVYTVSDMRGGAVLLKGQPLSDGTFTQADLDVDDVSFLHDGSEGTSAGFTFVVSDGEALTSPKPFIVSVDPVNDAPVVSVNTRATVNEGGNLLLASTLLGAEDPDTADDNVQYTVTNFDSGSLLISGEPLLGSTFTQAQLTAGLVSFQHDGSEGPSAGFTFTVSDGVSTTPPFPFDITVIPVNDPPVVITNTVLTVREGGTVPISGSQLQAQDPDTGDSDLVYTIVSVQSGVLLFNGQAPVGTALPSFTQAELNSGAISFSHNGEEGGATAGFVFRVTDGSSSSDATTFTIVVTAVDDPPSVSNNGAAVLEGGSVVVSTSRLQASDVDTLPDQLVYTYSNVVGGSVLVTGRAPGAAAGTFTQADVDAGRVSFQHDGSEGGTAGFRFTLSDGTTTTPAQDFDILVSPVDDPPVVVANNGAQVGVGSSVAIGTAQLSARDPDTANEALVFSVSSLSGGSLLVDGRVPPGNSFTEADIQAGLVSFQHDGSSDSTAGFTFIVSDGTSVTSQATFTIGVLAAGVPPFVIVSGGSVVEGEQVTLTTSMLSVGNSGSAPPASFVFTVTSQTGGEVSSPFTLADIQAGSVVFNHDGSEAPQAGFDFTVTDSRDGGVLESAGFLPLDVVPVDDLPEVNVQGGSVTEGGAVTITSDMLSVDDPDTGAAGIVIQVTGASNGQVAVNGETGATSFTLQDLQQGLVQFVHDGSESPSAGFEFSVSYFGDGGSPLLTGQNFPLDVNPVDDAPEVDVGRGVVEKGGQVAITTELLQATDPDSPPASIVFTVTDTTRGDVLVGGVPVTTFTMADVESGQVVFEHDGGDGQTASFGFTVANPGSPELALPEQTMTLQVAPGPTVVNNGGEIFQVRQLPNHLSNGFLLFVGERLIIESWGLS
jgi:hypothetical protein